MRCETATSWDNLQELLFSGAWNAQIQRHRSPYAFRGMEIASLPWLPR